MIHSTLRIITPKKAAKMLKEHIPNRALKSHIVQRYARDMTGGNWDVNGQSIVISDKKELIDGQHRLHACIKSGTSFSTFVTTGVDETSKITIDCGKKRQFAHTLQMDGVLNSTNVAGAIQAVHHIFDGSTNSKLTNHEMQDFLDKYPDLHNSCQHIVNRRALAPKPSVLSAVHFLATQFLPEGRFNGENLANEFHGVFYTGIPYYTSISGGRDAAHVWRERLIKEMHRPNSSLTRKSIMFGTVHAWNLFAKGTTVTSFKIPKNVKMEGLPTSL